MINLKELEFHSKAVADLRQKVTEYKNHLANIRSLCGQNGYEVIIGGVRVRVADMDHTYIAKLIRGREMIHLGALKAMGAMVDSYTDALADAESKLAAVATGTKP